jgi:peptidoglycan/xylan/chitin deacetylase (PgdA/CDA1 family)
MLKAQKLELTLFLTGAALLSDRGFIAEALNAGMEIGNHTMDHADLTTKSYAGIQKDLLDFEAFLDAAVPGATTKPYMRPPGGAVNRNVALAAAELGYRPVNWNSSSGDGSLSTTPENMVKYAMQNAAPGAIILMHFGPRALIALPALVEQLRAKGLEPVSLSRLFAAAG